MLIIIWSHEHFVTANLTIVRKISVVEAKIYLKLMSYVSFHRQKFLNIPQVGHCCSTKGSVDNFAAIRQLLTAI